MLLVIKKALLTGLTLSLLMLTGQAQALTTDTVGELDEYIDGCDLLNVNETSLASCVSDVLTVYLSTDVVVTADMVIKIDEVADLGLFEAVDDGLFLEDGITSLTYAMEITESDYFVINTGNVDGTVLDTFVFLNNDEKTWAYISLILNEDIVLVDIFKISNISAVVPVPAAVWLFGSALLGLVGVARRKNA
jgi:hypothetical protein